MGLLVCDNSAKECIYAGLKILFVAILLELVHSGEHANCFTASKCGDGGPEIEYPFYIRGCGRDLFGYPGFDVRCEGKRTMYRNFSIESIFYESQSFRLVSGDVINTSCPTPAYHYDPKNIFLNYTSNHATLIFFYNCTKSTSFKNPVYNLTCASSTGNYSFVALVRGEKCFSPSTGFCRWGSFMPVDLKEGRGISNLSNGDDYQKLLSYGFTLKWQLMSDNSCTRCRKSGGQCGRKKGGNFACYCSGRAYQDDCYDNNKDFWWNRKTGAIVGLSVLLIGLLSYIFYLNRRYNSLKFHLRNSSLYPSCNQDIEESNVYHEIPIFTCTELEEATNKFSSTNELGHGGFGTVYYGKLLDGREVAVKRLYDQSCRRVKQFMNEVEILTRLRHKNLVSLYGCTSCHSQELLLVYEYLSNGTVADHLHGNQQNPTSLPWHVRMSIAIETATALAYLHTSDIIHRDVKTENILLDKNYGVKVADFGLSRLFPHDVSHISTAPQGTPGYVDPEYHQFYQLTEKSDVYSFGVVLIELISSKPAVDISRERHEINLASFALDKIQKGALSELIDPTLGFETDSEIHRIIISVAELAFRCLQHEKETRPSMSEVLAELDAIARSENTANKPVNVDEGGNAPLPFPPQCDDVALLKSMLLMYSPVSVTQKWSSSSNSRSCTASTAPPGAASANSEEFSM